MSDKYKKVDKEILANTLLDTLPNPIYYKDTQGSFINCNRAFEELVCASKEEIIGKSAYEFFTEEISSRHKIIDKKILQTHGTYVDDVIFYTKSGKIKYFTLIKSIYINIDKSIGGTVCVMTDITKDTKDKEILVQQAKFSEMGEMIASIAHQWNEPLVELSAQIQKLEYYFLNQELDNAKVSNFVNDSMIQVQYMSETLNDFRNFLKPSKIKDTFDIKDAVREIFDIIGRQMANFSIKVIYEFEEKQIYVYGYKNEIKQVLLNILNNAKNKIITLYKKNGFIGTIKIKIFTCKDWVNIQIIDDAGEIDKKILEHIFEPFFTTKDKGTGYGLYMAKDIIQKRHNGIISAENIDKNAVFSIKLPNKEKI